MANLSYMVRYSFSLSIICLFIFVSVVTAVHMGRSENNFLEPFLSYHCTLVSKLVPKTYPKPSHLPSKTFDIVFTNQGVEVWRDGSVVKSTNCSSRGLRFSSQCPHGSSLSVTPVPGDLTSMAKPMHPKEEKTRHGDTCLQSMNLRGRFL